MPVPSLVRSGESPAALLPSIRNKVHELDPELALAKVRTMDEWLADSAAQPRLNSLLLAVFASAALIIAAIGIYGVLSYSVSQRTREIGLRMALGATLPNVLRLVIAQGMKLAVIGTGIGLVGGLVRARFVSSLVFGITVRDPATFAAVAIFLSLVALAACVFPARNAVHIDPAVALRE